MMKPVGKPDAGKLHVRFDERGGETERASTRHRAPPRLYYFERSLDIARMLGDRRAEASGYHQLGIISQEQGRYDEAHMYFERSLDIARMLGDRRAEASGYHHLGSLALCKADYELALNYF